MATNVTVLGAAGGTVTIPITSAANAVVAQSALAGISMAVLAGTLTQVEYTGAISLPGAVSAGIGVVEQGGTSALAPFGIGNNYVDAVLDGGAKQALVTGVNPGEIIVSGPDGAVVDNFATDTRVFFGGGTNRYVAAGSPLFGLAPTAQVYVDGAAYFDASFGATTIFAGTGATLYVANTGSGANTVELEAGSPSSATNEVVLEGSGTTAATVNAAGAGLLLIQDGGAAIIDADGSNVTVLGVAAAGGGWWSGGGSVTLFGGTGTDSVTGGTGLFEAGSGGGSLLVSSALPGAATLVGGGEADTLQAMGSGDFMTAGSGNETLLGGKLPVTISGFAGAEAPGAVTNMIGGAAGGNSFAIGNGITSITGNHGGAGGNVYRELTSGQAAVEITDFVSALNEFGVPVANPDMISLARPGGGSYQLIEQAGLPAANQVSFDYVTGFDGTISTEVLFGDGATWTLIGSVLHADDFH